MLITATVDRGDPHLAAAHLRGEPRRVQEHLNRTMRMLAADLEPLYATYAPVDTEQLKRSIDTRVSFRAAQVRITVTADARRDRFNYLQVTRTGHARMVIVPRRKKALKVYVHGRFATPVRRASVRGSHPRSDWVEVATRHASHIYERHERTLERRITAAVQ